MANFLVQQNIDIFVYVKNTFFGSENKSLIVKYKRPDKTSFTLPYSKATRNGKKWPAYWLRINPIFCGSRKAFYNAFGYGYSFT